MGNKALLAVDVQIDFCPGGALAVPGGHTIVKPLNEYIEYFSKQDALILASRNWHPEISNHFKTYGGEWPEHCIENTAGAQFYPELNLPEDTVIISKGRDPKKPGYSAFHGSTEDGTSLLDVLKQHEITDLYVAGLATDYCIKHTVFDALREGFNVYVLTDAIKGIDMTPGDSYGAAQEMFRRGASLVSKREVTGRASA